LARNLRAREVQRLAAERNIEVVPFDDHFYGPPTMQGLQLGFAAVDEREIRRGVEQLRIVLAAASRLPVPQL
jgi:GntR family transcriptional regulator / MocR family aminotransferase